MQHVGDLLSRPADLDLLLVQVEVEKVGDPLNIAALSEESLKINFENSNEDLCSVVITNLE